MKVNFSSFMIETRSSEILRDQLSPQIVSDIDGTLNEEHLPESQRMGSIGPAKRALRELGCCGLPVSLMSSRTLAEIKGYAEGLGTEGFLIGEDGGVIELPSTLTEEEFELIQSQGFQITEFDGRRVVKLSETTPETYKYILETIEKATGDHIVSTVTSTPQELMESANHDSIAMAKASMQRATSAYAVRLTTEQLEIARQIGSEYQIRVLQGTYDNVTQFFGNTNSGEPADKGAALEAMSKIIHTLNGKTMLPIVIGNGKNDIPLWKYAQNNGGMAVLIPDKDGKPFMEEDLIPQGVVRATKPSGHGVIEVVPEIIDFVNKSNH